MIRTALNLVSLFYFVTECFSKSDVTGPMVIPCKKNDELCMIKSANAVVKSIAAGISQLDVKPLDPYDPGDIEGGDLFHYKFQNHTLAGLSKCLFTKLNLEESNLKFNLDCPSLIMHGYYEISGKLLNIPLEGHGIFTITGKCLINIDATIEKMQDTNGKTIIAIKTFESDIKPIKPIDYKFDQHHFSILNQNISAEALALFDREKINQMPILVTPPYMHSLLEVLFKNVNKFLYTIPLESLLLN